MSAIADTSFLLALMNKAETTHQACVKVFEAERKIYVLQSALAEITYMLGRSGGNQRIAYFLRYLPSVAEIETIPLMDVDFLRTADILDKYADVPLDFVDASIVAVAERLQITRILTLDRRDFQILRPQHIPFFELLP